MDIGIIEPHLKYGIGGIRRIIEVSNGLQKKGHNIIIFTPTGNKCTWIKNDIPTIKLSKMHKYEFDISMFNLAEQYKWCINSRSKKKVFWVLAPEALYKNPVIPIESLNQKQFYFLANSKFTSNYIKMHRSNIKYDIPIIHGGININHFKYEPNMPKTSHILYSGSPRPWKGTDIIEAAIRGEPWKSVKMHGLGIKQKDMFKYYNSSTIFVSACQSEGFSFPELEAMACGCCIVTTDSGGNREYIKPYENAFIVKRNPSDIKRGIKILLNDKIMRRKLRMNGIKTANQEKFTWDYITNKLEQELFRIIKDN